MAKIVLIGAGSQAFPEPKYLNLGSTLPPNN
jgi:alpha-galactosidase/6-phospho-beta-glucosidase family protein